MDGEEGMDNGAPQSAMPNYVTITFPEDGDVQIGGNATIVQMFAAAKLLERAAGGMLDQAELSALQARQSLLALPRDHMKGRRS